MLITAVVVGIATYAVVRSTHPTTGEPCGSHWSCRDGQCLWVERSAREVVGAERGVCFRRCERDVECGDGERCRGFAHGHYCVRSPATGEPCGPAELCGEPDTCILDPATSPDRGTCRASCYEGASCRGGLRCREVSVSSIAYWAGGHVTLRACVP